jgi:hypothetical protein
MDYFYYGIKYQSGKNLQMWFVLRTYNLLFSFYNNTYCKCLRNQCENYILENKNQSTWFMCYIVINP